MDTEFLKWLTSLGVGGVLAGGMFWVYRKDALHTQQRLIAIADKLIDTLGKVHGSLGEITTLMQTLIRHIDAQEGKH